MFEQIKNSTPQDALASFEAIINRLNGGDAISSILCSFVKCVFHKDVQNRDAVEQVISSLSQKFKRSVCGKTIRSMAVRCETCSTDPHSIYCLECFEEDKHRGHRYQFRESNGMCDCGFRFSVCESSFCKQHYGSHIIKSLDETKDEIDTLAAAALTYVIFRGYLSAVQNQQNEIATLLQQVISCLYFTYPIDTLRRLVTNVLFLNCKNFNEIARDVSIQELVCPYIDIQQVMKDFIQRKQFSCPMICIFSHLERVSQESHVIKLTKHLVDDLISEPTYRTILLYYFYMRFTALREDTVAPFLAQLPKTKIKKEIWAAAPVQLCSNIHMDDVHTILFGISQLSNYFLGAQTIAQCKIDEMYQQLDVNPIVKRFQEGFIQLKQLGATDDQIKFVLQLVDSVMPLIRTMPEMDQEHSMDLIFEVSNLKYSLLADVYSGNNIHYMAVQMNNKALALLHIYAHSLRQQASVYRLRDKDCIEDDKLLINNIHMGTFNTVTIFNFVWAIYIAGLVGTEFDRSTDTSSDIMRSNHNYDIDLVKQSINGLTIIENVLSSSIFVLLSSSLKNKNHYHYSTQNLFPQCPTGHGYHTTSPIFKSDVNAAGQKFIHPLYNTNIGYAAMMINCYNHYYIAGLVTVPTHLFLQNILEQIKFTNQLEKYNATILYAYNLRTLVTYAMYAAEMFVKLASTTKYMQRFYNPADRSFSAQLWHSFVVIQQLMKIIPSQQFIYQFFEAYGFVEPTTGKFVYRMSQKEAEDPDKMAKMLHVALKHLGSLLFCEMLVKSPEDYKIKCVLQVFCSMEQPTEKTLNSYLEQQQLHNSEKFHNLYCLVASKVGQQNLQPDLYSSTQQVNYYNLNAEGLARISVFDPFFNTIPSTLQMYQKGCERAKLPHMIPMDSCKAPFMAEVISEYMGNDTVQQAIIYTMYMYQKGKHATNESLADLVIIFALFKQLCQYVDDNKIFEISKIETTCIGQIKDVIMTQLEKKQIPSQLEELAKQITQKQQITQKTQVNVKMQERLQKLKAESQPQIKSQLLQIQDDELAPSSTMAINQQFIEQLKTIKKYDTSCSICQFGDHEEPLCIFCSVSTDNQQILGQSGYHKQIPLPEPSIKHCVTNVSPQGQPYQQIILHSCSHKIHGSCYTKGQRMVSCPLCRQLTGLVLPIIEGTVNSITLTKLLYTQCGQVQIQSDLDRQQLVKKLKTLDIVLFFCNTNKTARQTAQEQIGDKDVINDLLSVLPEFLHNVSLFYIKIVIDNIRSYITKMSLDLYSTPDQKNRMYREMLNTCSAATLAARMIHKLTMEKFEIEPQLFLDFMSESDEQLRAISMSLLLDYEIQTDSADERAVLSHISQLIEVSQFNQIMFDEISQYHPANIAQVQVSAERYLVNDDIAEATSFYQALVYSSRQALLEKFANPVSSSELVIANKFSLTEFFTRDYVSLIKQMGMVKCKACRQPAAFACLSCGQSYCHDCFSEETVEEHGQSCAATRCFLYVDRNLVLFCRSSQSVYFTGAPYLDNDNEDDCQRIKNVPLYLNGELLANLQRTLLWGMDYKKDASKCTDFERLKQVIAKWNTKE